MVFCPSLTVAFYGSVRTFPLRRPQDEREALLASSPGLATSWPAVELSGTSRSN